MRRSGLIAQLSLTTALTGAGAISCCAVYAQEITVEPTARAVNPPPAAAGEETPAQETVLFEADAVERDVEDGPIVATGDVTAYFGERYLRADKLIYDPATDIVIAEGNVAITDDSLETAFAGRVELTGDLRDGIIENFSALLANNMRLAADNATREQGARTRLSKAVYTACNVCNDEGEGKTPTWRMKALRVVRDEERKVVRFHHAWLEVLGVPLLYAPYIQGPDPSVERMSGLLAPVVGLSSSRIGFNIEVPYYLAISNSQDATFFPKYTTKDGILWQGEYRRRLKDGYHVVSGGVIDFDNTGQEEDGIPGVRWHYFGKGHQALSDNWRVSYDVERVSDDIYLRRYNILRRGDLRQQLDRARTNRLRSNARVEWNRGGHHLQVDNYLFQGLRDGDDPATTPYVLPLVDYRYDLGRRFAGGRTSLRANMASLLRTGGTDTQRFTASAYWERTMITDGGHRFHAFAEARGDAYYFQDLDEGTETLSGVADEDNRFEARFAPSAGVEWSYPLARNFGAARVFIEPRVQLVASPARQNPDTILNEDSQSIEFDYAGLFDYNKATGYDSFEDGQRINAGVAASVDWPNGIEVETAIGQQYRLQTTDAFRSGSGLGGKSSDIVGSLNVNYRKIVGIENRFRIDDSDGSIPRAESMAFVRAGPVTGNVSYVRLNEENVQAALVRREELTASGRIKITDHWSTGAAWRLDLEGNRTIRQDFFVGYQDECSTLGLTLRRDRTQANNLQPDTAVLLSFTLRGLVD